MMPGMAEVVHLHIGAPKTGTTYLQDRLGANRKELARHGVTYPVGLRNRNHFPAALDLLDISWGGLREGTHGEWDALVKRVRRAPGRVVLSHEVLASATPAQVSRAMGDLAGAAAEVHLVYSARDIARQVPAEWQETVKHQRRRSFRGFLRQVRRADRRQPTTWFWRVQGLPDVLGRWSVGLPPDRVHLVTVPPEGGPPGELWRRYCTALGLDPAWAPKDRAMANPSIGIEETAVIRELNRRLAEAGVDPAVYRRVVRHRIVHETLAQRPGMRRVTLPPRAHPWALDVAEEWVEWVRGSGIDVVGDLEDLRPRPPDPGAWQDPDRPRPRRLADATMDALVVTVLEAAEAQRPVAFWLRRAVRLLRGL